MIIYKFSKSKWEEYSHNAPIGDNTHSVRSHQEKDAAKKKRLEPCQNYDSIQHSDKLCPFSPHREEPRGHWFKSCTSHTDFCSFPLSIISQSVLLSFIDLYIFLPNVSCHRWEPATILQSERLIPIYFSNING